MPSFLSLVSSCSGDAHRPEQRAIRNLYLRSLKLGFNTMYSIQAVYWILTVGVVPQLNLTSTRSNSALEPELDPLKFILSLEIAQSRNLGVLNEITTRRSIQALPRVVHKNLQMDPTHPNFSSGWAESTWMLSLQL